ncbi:uncharacterized protein K452DRAFT_298501 [Aplosporella prunicola CBS 121167]|uniref:Complex 1 LYR protein domain-containing protein n=1 Tax=Aplosporella prunicola CBS 121167 TaxID=1176127 RepID=A0A6A6BC98_9PEZI|nr:uncharacterized protein K452DRAFT_298501 [Aplosporella prunicola CBS 121167]KAF2141839.1 hypothetical protein K452DRAFT_298501 [Aplosporella prunicola CBS 121167]
MARLSGLQRDVLALYRQCLRATRQKPLETRPHFRAFARQEFEKNLAIEKRDFAAIEYMLRRGHRQLEIYEDPGIRDVHR